MNRKVISATFFTLSIMLLVSCTFTRTKTREQAFNDTEQIKREVSTLIVSDSLSFVEKEVTKINDLYTELLVKVINPENVPEDGEEKKALAKAIALRVKNNLEQSNRYNQYEVSFISIKGSDLVSSSITHKHTFMDNEL